MSYKDGKLDKNELEEILNGAKKKEYNVLDKFDKNELKEANEEIVEMKKENDEKALNDKTETINNIVNNIK